MSESTIRLDLVPKKARDICQHVCNRHGLEPLELWESKRTFLRVHAARREAWDLLHTAGYGYREISRWWGVDHKAVWGGVKKLRVQ